MAQRIRSFGPDVLRVMEDLNGHTITKHVSKTPQWLIERANKEGVDASTFKDLSTASKAVLENLRNNADSIATYLSKAEKGTRPKAFQFTHSYSIGYGIKKGRKTIQGDLNISEIIINFDESSPLGFVILTGMTKMK